MCGRFAQSQTREDYLALLAEDIERDIPYDPEPIGRYNVAPGTKVLLLSERDEHLHLDPVFWGYAPGWWDKPPLINARVETAATSRMFKPLWQHGRAICFADGWFEWKKEGDKKQPYFIYRADGQPVFMAAIGSTPFERGDEAEGFLIVTAAADQGLVDIHDRRRWFCRQKLRGNGCGKRLAVKKPQKSRPVAVFQQTSSPGTRYRARWVMLKTRVRS